MVMNFDDIAALKVGVHKLAIAIEELALKKYAQGEIDLSKLPWFTSNYVPGDSIKLSSSHLEKNVTRDQTESMVKKNGAKLVAHKVFEEMPLPDFIKEMAETVESERDNPAMSRSHDNHITLSTPQMLDDMREPISDLNNDQLAMYGNVPDEIALVQVGFDNVCRQALAQVGFDNVCRQHIDCIFPENVRLLNANNMFDEFLQQYQSKLPLFDDIFIQESEKIHLCEKNKKGADKVCLKLLSDTYTNNNEPYFQKNEIIMGLYKLFDPGIYVLHFHILIFSDTVDLKSEENKLCKIYIWELCGIQWYERFYDMSFLVTYIFYPSCSNLQCSTYDGYVFILALLLTLEDKGILEKVGVESIEIYTDLNALLGWKKRLDHASWLFPHFFIFDPGGLKSNSIHVEPTDWRNVAATSGYKVYNLKDEVGTIVEPTNDQTNVVVTVWIFDPGGNEIREVVYVTCY